MVVVPVGEVVPGLADLAVVAEVVLGLGPELVPDSAGRQQRLLVLAVVDEPVAAS